MRKGRKECTKKIKKGREESTDESEEEEIRKK
jgi:hypothetical protein